MLSERQRKILQIIEGNPKITLTQLADILKLKAVSAAHTQVKKLIEENFLVREGRTLKRTHRDENEFTPIPFYGFAQCGDTDIFAEENIVDYVNMPTKFLPLPTHDLFFMKAKGDSMEPFITEGEMLMFRRTNGTLPPVNSVVLCRREDGLKIKRLSQFNSEEGPQYRLISDNKAKYEPFPADESVEILGKLVRMN